MLHIAEFSQKKTTEYGNTDRSLLLESYIASAAAGETDGIAMLYEETKSSVYGFALSILKNASDAEDVTHDTYVKIFSCADSYSPKGTPMPWILQITKNIAFSLLRKRNRLTLVQQEQLSGVAEGGDVAEDTCDGISVVGAMMALGDTERQIVTLHAVSGLKHREIAKVLEIPLPTVLSKYNRAIKKLQKMLGDDNDV